MQPYFKNKMNLNTFQVISYSYWKQDGHWQCEVWQNHLIKCIEIDVLALVEFRQYYLLLLKEIKTINCKIVTDPHPLLPSFSCLKIRDIQYENFPTSNSHFPMSFSVEMEFNNNLIIISLRMHVKFSVVLCSYLIF